MVERATVLGNQAWGPTTSRPWVVAVALALVSLCYTGLIIAFKGSPVVIGLAVIPFALVFFVAKPIYTLYFLIGATLAAELELTPPWMAIQRGVSELSGHALDWLIVSPLEMLIVAALVVQAAKSMSPKAAPFRAGTFFRPMIPFLVFIAVGLVTGFMKSGDPRIALWEVRTLLYLPAVYLVFYNAIETKKQLHLVTWIVLFSLGVIALLGTWKYVVVHGGDLGNMRAMTEHPTAVFLNLILLFVVAYILYGAPKWQGRLAIALLPLVTVTLIAANRRAAYVALLVGLFLLLVLAFRDNRRAVLGLLAAGTVMSLLYVGAFWNSSSFLAKPLQGIKSVNAEPGSLDYYSNLYRTLEKWDIVATFRRSPVLGVGFGGKFDMPVELMYYDSPLRDYVPHNSVAWIWLKTGTGGFIAFLAFFGIAMMRAANLYRKVEDKQMKPILAAGLLFIVMDLIYSYVDQGWSPKETVFIATVLGMYAVTERISQAKKDQPVRASVADNSNTHSRSTRRASWSTGSSRQRRPIRSEERQQPIWNT